MIWLIFSFLDLQLFPDERLFCSLLGFSGIEGTIQCYLLIHTLYRFQFTALYINYKWHKGYNIRSSVFLEKLLTKANLGAKGAEYPGNDGAAEQADYWWLPVYRPWWEAVPRVGIVSSNFTLSLVTTTSTVTFKLFISDFLWLFLLPEPRGRESDGCLMKSVETFLLRSLDRKSVV